MTANRIIGLDPGLRRMGWGVIETDGARLRHCGHGVITSDDKAATAERLVQLHEALAAVLKDSAPHAAAVEETFVNNNPASTLKLGLARGICLLVPAQAGVAVHEYPANLIKKSVVGTGHAGKEQIQMMVARLLPSLGALSADAADALAVAICHSHHAQTRATLGGVMAGAAR